MADFIKSYQTVIVGVLGFLGVMATLAINAWLERKAERRRIEHETQILRTALIEEMKVQRGALFNVAESSKKAKDTNVEKQNVLTPLRAFLMLRWISLGFSLPRKSLRCWMPIYP